MRALYLYLRRRVCRQSATSGQADVARGQLRLLTDKVFGPFIVGQLLSTTGVWIYSVAAAVVVYDLSGSATLVGAISAAQFAPQLALAPWSGARADRGDRGRQLLTGRLMAAAGPLGVGIWWSYAGLAGTTGVLAVLAASLLMGVGFVLGSPAMQALVPSLVMPTELASAVSLNAATFTLGRALGPAIGAILLASAGPQAAFIVAAAGNLAFGIVLAFLRLNDAGRSPTVDGSVLAGLRYVLVHRRLLTLLLGVASVGAGIDPVVTLAPSIAAGLGGGSALVGSLTSAFGFGAALTYLAVGPVRRRFGLGIVARAGLGLTAAGMAILAVAHTPGLALVSLGVAGAGSTLALTSLTTQVQTSTPEELRGRIMALWGVCYLGSRPLAAGINGALADAASTATALAVVVAILLTAAYYTPP